MERHNNRLKAMRNRHDLTQEQVAKILGITRAAYSHYESGIRDIPTDLLIKLAKYYKCTTDELLGSWYYYAVIRFED